MSAGSVAVITGASSGIGAAIAVRFARAGMRVALAARRRDLLVQVADQVRAAGGEALVLPTDMSEAGAIDRMVADTIQAWGRIDVLVANAGIGQGGPLHKLSDEALVRQIDVNVLGVIRSARAVLPVMFEQGRGHIIPIASVAGEVSGPGAGIYSATKAAVLRFSEGLRRELGPRGITVSTVLPGFIETEMTRGNGLPFKMAQPAIVADAVYRLLARPRRRVVVPGWYRLAIGLNRWFPGLVDQVVISVERRSAKA